jgi:thiosulfate/3-mercaptopyruvate sulfurtransferase
VRAAAAGTGAAEIGKTLPQSVVTPQWLHDQIKSNSQIKVVDASWYMPNEKRDTLKEYKEGHIPGAVFFNVDKIADVTSDMSHMLPSETAFEQAASALGIKNDDWLVVYDSKGLFSAARVWWMFRVFGHEKVWILDGGLPNWKSNGFPVNSDGSQLLLDEDAAAAVQNVYSGKEVQFTNIVLLLLQL